MRDKHLGRVRVLLCHSYLAIGLSKLTLKWAVENFHDIVCVIGQSWVVVFQHLDWDSAEGIAWDVSLLFVGGQK